MENPISIINPIETLQDELKGKSAEEKKNYLKTIFSLERVDTNPEYLGAWRLIDVRGKIAIFDIKSSSLVTMPHKTGDSEYFGDFSLHGISMSDKHYLFVAVGGIQKDDTLVDIQDFGYIKNGTYTSINTGYSELQDCLGASVMYFMSQQLKNMTNEVMAETATRTEQSEKSQKAFTTVTEGWGKDADILTSDNTGDDFQSQKTKRILH